jgi:hypothetical protein
MHWGTSSCELKRAWGVSEHRERCPAQAKCLRSNTHRDGAESERKNRTVGRAVNAIWWASPRGVVVGRIVVAIRPPGDAAAPGQASVYLAHASQHIWERRCRCEASDARELESEHVQRGDSRVCDGHVMSAGFATMCQTSHTHNTHNSRVSAAAATISNYTGC